MSTDRQQLAQVFREKSTRSLAGAVSCWEDGNYPSACSRAWYATYQAITAGTFAKLWHKPGKNQENFEHKQMPGLFLDFVRASNSRVRYNYLVECIEKMWLVRVSADYLQSEEDVTADAANAAIAVARHVRNVIWEVLQWTDTTPVPASKNEKLSSD